MPFPFKNLTIQSIFSPMWLSETRGIYMDFLKYHVSQVWLKLKEIEEYKWEKIFTFKVNKSLVQAPFPFKIL